MVNTRSANSKAAGGYYHPTTLNSHGSLSQLELTMSAETTSQTDSLEQDLANSFIPCGGVVCPDTHPCPYNAEATWVLAYRCCDNPVNFKCNACYMEWLKYAVNGRFTKFNRFTCARCGYTDTTDPWDMYRPL